MSGEAIQRRIEVVYPPVDISKELVSSGNWTYLYLEVRDSLLAHI